MKPTVMGREKVSFLLEVMSALTESAEEVVEVRELSAGDLGLNISNGCPINRGTALCDKLRYHQSRHICDLLGRDWEACTTEVDSACASLVVDELIWNFDLHFAL